jgi:4-amino-4-deoxy-L-arabinose transferase-like glycosyltransferase
MNKRTSQRVPRPDRTGGVQRLIKRVPTDITLSILIFLSCVLITLPILQYQVVGDVSIYAEEVQNLYDHHSYGREMPGGWVSETDVPPFICSAALIFMPIVNNPVIAIHLQSIVFFSLAAVLTYWISRRLCLSRKSSVLITALVAFNPLFFYFTVIISGTESASVFLFLLSVYLFMTRKQSFSHYTLMGLSVGLFTMTRMPAVFIITPLIIYVAYELVKDQRNIPGKISFLFFSLIFGAWWLIRNYFLSQSLGESLYAGAYATHTNLPFNMLKMLGGTYLMALPILMLAATPLLAYQVYRIIRRRDGSGSDRQTWFLFFASVACWTLALATYPWRPVFVLARMLVAFVPLFTILAGIAYLHLADRFTLQRVRSVVAVSYLVISIVAMAWLNYGYLKDTTDRIVPLPVIYPQQSLHRAQAVTVLHRLNPSVVVGAFDERSVAVGMNRVFSYHLSPTTTYLVVEQPQEVSYQQRLRHYTLTTPGWDLQPIYVISAFDSTETSRILSDELRHIANIEEISRSGTIRVFRYLPSSTTEDSARAA